MLKRLNQIFILSYQLSYIQLIFQFVIDPLFAFSTCNSKVFSNQYEIMLILLFLQFINVSIYMEPLILSLNTLWHPRFFLCIYIFEYKITTYPNSDRYPNQYFYHNMDSIYPNRDVFILVHPDQDIYHNMDRYPDVIGMYLYRYIPIGIDIPIGIGIPIWKLPVL